MKTKKYLTILIAGAMSVAMFAGCSSGNLKDNGKVNITIGSWPYETDKNFSEAYAKRLEEFNKQYPDVEVVTDTYHYDTKTYTMKASANQLPTIYITPYTEFSKIINAGYAADLTDVMKKRGLVDAINPKLIEIVTDDEGRIRALPTSSYVQGLTINKSLFKQAGLVNGDGSIKLPQTYEELAEFAKKKKKKTGKAGFAMATTNNMGGWHFMNIAWSYGVEFMKQDENGKWIATFNSPEAAKALQLIKDLKWKYNALPDISVIDNDELIKLYALNQAAMIISQDPGSATRKYGMNVDDVALARLPGGPAGRYAQMGGEIRIFNANANEDQIEACFDWMKLQGFDVVTEYDDATKKMMQYNFETELKNNSIITGKKALSVWTNEEKSKLDSEIVQPYINVDLDDFNDYYNMEDITIKAEEPMCCQELYSVLDGCIQEVITNKNADITSLLEKANNDFQVNYLDKE